MLLVVRASSIVVSSAFLFGSLYFGAPNEVFAEENDDVAKYSAIIQSDPQNAEAYYLRADAWSSSGENEKAISDLDVCIQLDPAGPSSARAYFLRGKIHNGMNKLDRALADLDAAIAINTLATAEGDKGLLDSWELSSWRGQVLMLLDQCDRALVDYSDAIRTAPHEERRSAYFGRAQSNSGAGRHDAAIDDYTRALELGEQDDGLTNAIVLAQRAATWTDKRDYDAAIADCTQAIRIDPQLSYVLLTRAIAWEAKGEYAKAILDYSEYIRNNESSPDAYMSRGWLFFRSAPRWSLFGTANYEAALADFEQAAKLDPKYAESLRALAWFLSTCPGAMFRDGKRAVELATKAVELSAGEEKIGCQQTLAAALAESGDFDRAVTLQADLIAQLRRMGKPTADATHRFALYMHKQTYSVNPEVERKVATLRLPTIRQVSTGEAIPGLPGIPGVEED
jgi:tetratricopeptide (TPR) repeat protein